MRHRFAKVVLLLGSVLAARGGIAQELSPVSLPAPQTEGGKPLMQALKLRATARAFAPDPLPPQTLANLLWAAWGINRPQEGKRTAPSTRNWQEIEVVVLSAAGAYTSTNMPPDGTWSPTRAFISIVAWCAVASFTSVVRSNDWRIWPTPSIFRICTGSSDSMATMVSLAARTA